MHSSELKAELAEVQRRISCLKDEISTYKNQIKIAEKELYTLAGSIYQQGGTAWALRCKITQAERRERDANAITVVWKEEPTWGKDRRVVRKITKKRIYVACEGDAHETYYSKDGTRHSTDGVIDLAATFGENYEEILQ